MLVWMTEGPQALRDSQPPDGKLAGVPLLETGRELGSGGGRDEGSVGVQQTSEADIAYS